MQYKNSKKCSGNPDSRSKSETTTGSLWKAQNLTAKIDYCTKNLSPPTLFDINTSEFQEMFLDIFENSVGRNLRKYFFLNNY